MSIYNIENYKYNMMHEPTPSWMKNERYEYCDSYVNGSFNKDNGKKKGKKFKALFSLFTLA